MAPQEPAKRFCEMCGAAVSLRARFCGSCGEELDALADASRAPEVVSDEQDTAVPRPEHDDGSERELYNERPLVLQSFFELFLTLITLGLWGLVLWIRRMQDRYVITTQRIELVDGILSLRRRTIEHFRVQDFEIDEPLFLRLRSAGNLIVRSMDPEEPVETLVAVPQVREVHETLRRAVLASRQDNRVRLLEGM